MTNTDIATEILHRLERMNVGGTGELPRDSGSPPTITLAKRNSYEKLDFFLIN
jgi:hypothetical protein